MNVHSYILRCQKRVNITLDKLLPSSKTKPRRLHEAMRYTTLGGGKRLRSALIYATGEAFGAKKNILDHICAAIEMIHAFSLIHDDLPSLDDDDLRRGKPTCHIVFGEATAILAGDALQTLAFSLIANLDKKKLPPKIAVTMLKELTKAIGSLGMAGGEELDILSRNKKISLQELKYIYKLKTAYLLSVGIELGALAAGCQDRKIINKLKKFSEHIGIAFQIHDDIIGIESHTKILGKTHGADRLRNKPTYPSLVGLPKAKKHARIMFHQAMSYLKDVKVKTNKLAAIANYLIERNF